MIVQQLPAAGATQLTDLHLWRVGRDQFACILRLTTSAETLTSQVVRERLAQHPALVHSTVEVIQRDVALATSNRR
jgi:Co/Zn/Cd efflux system component